MKPWHQLTRAELQGFLSLSDEQARESLLRGDPISRRLTPAQLDNVVKQTRQIIRYHLAEPGHIPAMVPITCHLGSDPVETLATCTDEQIAAHLCERAEVYRELSPEDMTDLISRIRQTVGVGYLPRLLQ